MGFLRMTPELSSGLHGHMCTHTNLHTPINMHMYTDTQIDMLISIFCSGYFISQKGTVPCGDPVLHSWQRWLIVFCYEDPGSMCILYMVSDTWVQRSEVLFSNSVCLSVSVCLSLSACLCPHLQGTCHAKLMLCPWATLPVSWHFPQTESKIQN